MNQLVHYFFPHESNNYKAKSLHNQSILFYICLILFFQVFSSLVKRSQPQILGYAADVTVDKIYQIVNQERQKTGLPPLSSSSELSEAATKKAADMFENNYWAHVSPNGTTPWKFILDANYDYLYAGENLAKDFDRSEDIVEAWMKSPTHRANILKPEYSDLGLAVLNGKLNGMETTLVVQEFGTKKDKALPVQISQSNKISGKNNTQIDTVNLNVVGQTDVAKTPFFKFSISRSLSLFVAEILMIVLFIDSIYIWKTKTMRISGRSFAHLIFILALIGAMGFTGIGVIL